MAPAGALYLPTPWQVFPLPCTALCDRPSLIGDYHYFSAGRLKWSRWQPLRQMDQLRTRLLVEQRIQLVCV